MRIIALAVAFAAVLGGGGGGGNGREGSASLRERPQLTETLLDRRNGASAAQSVTALEASVPDWGWVTFNVSTAAPAYGDWLGVFSPSTADPKLTVPLLYIWLDDLYTSNAGAYAAPWSGVLKTQLINARADYVAHFFTNGTGSAQTLVASSAPVAIAGDYNAPQRVRVLGTGSPDSLRVVWSSASGTSAAVLQWATAPGGQYTVSVPAVTTHLQPSDLCGAPASGRGWRDLGFTHTATLTGLAGLAGRAIYYSVGDDSGSAPSREASFRVPPAPGTLPTAVLFFGDYGRGFQTLDSGWQTYSQYAGASFNTSLRLNEALDRDPAAFDAFILNGDVSYATGFAGNWDWMLAMAENMTARLPMAVTVGNHESAFPGGASLFQVNDSGGECGVSTQHLFQLPEPATVTQPWWSWEVGAIHFVGMSTEHAFDAGSPQLAWLEADLAAVDRARTPFIVAALHRPMYIDSTYAFGRGGTGDIEVANALQASVEPVLMRHRVTLAVYGHNHAVQRLSAAYRNATVLASVPAGDGSATRVFVRPRATVHAVIGTGGADFTVNAHAAGSRPPWSERVQYAWGFGVITAINATALAWRFHDSSTPAAPVLESVLIIQDIEQAWADVLPSAAAAAPPVAAIVGGVLGAATGLAAIALAAHRAGWWRRAAAGDYGKIVAPGLTGADVGGGYGAVL